MFPSFWAGPLYIYLNLCFDQLHHSSSNLYELHSSFVIFLRMLHFSNLSITKICWKKHLWFFSIAGISETYTFIKVINKQIFNSPIIETNICYNFIELFSTEWHSIASATYFQWFKEDLNLILHFFSVIFQLFFSIVVIIAFNIEVNI